MDYTIVVTLGAFFLTYLVALCYLHILNDRLLKHLVVGSVGFLAVFTVGQVKSGPFYSIKWKYLFSLRSLPTEVKADFVAMALLKKAVMILRMFILTTIAVVFWIVRFWL